MGVADYSKNFLKSVVVRIDFNQTELKDVNKYLLTLKDRFVNQKKETGHNAEVRLDVKDGVPNTSHTDTEFNVWKLSDSDESVLAVFTPTFLLIEYKKYRNSKQLLADIQTVFDTFIEHFNIPTLNRVGMLYSNLITVGHNTNPTTWGDYINGDLLGGISFAKKNSFEFSRNMGQIIKHGNENDVRFDFGIWNRDFPNQVARKEFVLEYDCYSNIELDASDVKMSELIESYNSQIDELFEASIKDKLRALMQ